MNELEKMARNENEKARYKEIRRRNNQIGLIAAIVIFTILGFAAGVM